MNWLAVLLSRAGLSLRLPMPSTTFYNLCKFSLLNRQSHVIHLNQMAVWLLQYLCQISLWFHMSFSLAVSETTVRSKRSNRLRWTRVAHCFLHRCIQKLSLNTVGFSLKVLKVVSYIVRSWFTLFDYLQVNARWSLTLTKFLDIPIVQFCAQLFVSVPTLHIVTSFPRRML
jgi:hypothetical protein